MNVAISPLTYVELMFFLITFSLLLVAMFYLKSLKRKMEFKAIAIISVYLLFEISGVFVPNGLAKDVLYNILSRALLLVALALLLVRDRAFFSKSRRELI